MPLQSGQLYQLNLLAYGLNSAYRWFSFQSENVCTLRVCRVVSKRHADYRPLPAPPKPLLTQPAAKCGEHLADTTVKILSGRDTPIGTCHALNMAQVCDSLVASVYRNDIIYRFDILMQRTGPVDIKGLCLGVLTFGDATGYDIKKFFECTFSHFFKAGYGSIYPALAELSNEGLVSYRVDHQEGKPDRKIYHINKNGHEHFIKQLCSTPPRHSVKSEFLVLMFFAHLLPVEQLNHILVERLGDITRQLELTAERQTQMSDMNCPPGIRFATELGLAVMQAARGYIETHHKELLAAVQEVQKSPSLASTNCWQNQSKPKH